MYLPQMRLPLGWLHHKGRLEQKIQEMQQNSPHKIRQITSLQDELRSIGFAFGDPDESLSFQRGKQTMWVVVSNGFLFCIAQRAQGLGHYEVWNADAPGSQRRLRYPTLSGAYKAAWGMYADNAYVIGKTWCQLILNEFGFAAECYLDPVTHMLVFTVITKTMPTGGSAEEYHRVVDSEIFQCPVPLQEQDLDDVIQKMRNVVAAAV